MSTSHPTAFEAEHQPQLSAAWSANCGGAVRDIQISNDGVVAVSTDSGIRLFVGERGFTLLQELVTSPAKLTAFKFSRGGGEVITGASDGFLKWWDVHTGEETCSTQFPVTKGGDNRGEEEEELTGEAPAISALACSTEGELVAATGGRTVCIFGHGGVHLHTIGPLISPVIAMEWRSASELAVNVGSGIQMFTIAEDHYEVGQGLGAEADGCSLTVVAAAPGEKLLAAGCSNGSVQIWNLENGDDESLVAVKVSQQKIYDTEVACLAWDEGGNYLATAGGNEVIVWDMSDNGGELKDGRDDCIVCYGHEQKAKITALAFQPGGELLATGGDDCRVLVFDSTSFSSNVESVGGLAGSLGSGRVVPKGTEAAVTAVAWHPSGLVLAGTSSGKVDAFEVVAGVDGDNAKKEKPPAEVPFLMANPEMPCRRAPGQQAMQGWGGQPLIANNGGPENQHTAKGWPTFGPRTSNGAGGNMGPGGRRGPRHQGGSRAKVIFNQLKSNQTSRPPYPEGTQQPWPAVIHPTPMGMMRWPPVAYPAQVQYPQLVHQQMPQAPVMGPYAPHNPQTGNFVKPGQMPAGPSMMPRIPMPPPQANQYPMAYMPFPQPYPMAYPQQYTYYAQVGAQHLQEQMAAQPPPVMGPGGLPNSAAQIGSKRASNGMQRAASSPDFNEDDTSKSSERTNNGVNSLGPVTPSESSTSYEQDNGRMAQGLVTLYIGNLAPSVEETMLYSCFAQFGQISSVQVIRDRDTKQSRGFAFITYGHPMWAQSAMRSMDGVTFTGPFEGRRLKVSFSNRRP